MQEGSSAFFSRPSSSSSAIKIVKPPEGYVETRSPSKLRDSSTQLCREYVINGTCSKSDCPFNHPNEAKPGSPTPSDSMSSTLSLAASAPVFVPKSGLSPPPTANGGQSSASFVPLLDPNANVFAFTPDDNINQLTSSMQSFNPYETHPDMSYDSSYEMYDPTINSYFPPQVPYMEQPLDYHLYTLPIPETFSHNYFVSDGIRTELQKRSEALRATPYGLAPALPDELQGYHSLVPLEPETPERRKFGNWYSTVYKAVSERDGVTYALRRIENYRLTQQAGLTPIEAWSRVRHPGIISVHEGFSSRAFGDNSLVVAYAHHPSAKTLAEEYLKHITSATNSGTSTPVALPTGGRHAPFGRQRTSTPSTTSRIPERTLWTYIVQIANAIKVVHDAGLAVRVLDATKVLITGKNRVRISSCGIVDVLTHDVRPAPDLAMLQQEDLAAFGRLVLTLCCANPHAVSNLGKAVEIVQRHYSVDVKNVALFLVSKPTPHKSIAQLFDMLGSRLLTEMDEMQNAVDRLEGELMSELENGRLVRLLCKFGFINERPEFARDSRWSETGDRYIIKLFRDYVFHQVDENGNPLLNMGHVLTCLSKLDAGTEERLMLVSRDEQSCLVVSYREVKACVEAAFAELVNPTASTL